MAMDRMTLMSRPLDLLAHPVPSRPGPGFASLDVSGGASRSRADPTHVCPSNLASVHRPEWTGPLSHSPTSDTSTQAPGSHVGESASPSPNLLREHRLTTSLGRQDRQWHTYITNNPRQEHQYPFRCPFWPVSHQRHISIAHVQSRFEAIPYVRLARTLSSFRRSGRSSPFDCCVPDARTGGVIERRREGNSSSCESST
jgi:hypothetical protein